jgi:hypothetical protein
MCDDHSSAINVDRRGLPATGSGSTYLCSTFQMGCHLFKLQVDQLQRRGTNVANRIEGSPPRLDLIEPAKRSVLSRPLSLSLSLAIYASD